MTRIVDDFTSYWFPGSRNVASSPRHDRNPATDIDRSEVKSKRAKTRRTLDTSNPFPPRALDDPLVYEVSCDPLQSRTHNPFERKNLRPELHDPSDVGPVPLTLPSLGLSEEKWRQLEYSSRLTIPRFLFRGFHSASGGGSDPRLNSVEGIVPHAFLNWEKPTNIYEIPHLYNMVNGHLRWDRGTRTAFSSWTADFWLAVRYSTGLNRYIAILDTTLIESHVRVYHVLSLVHAGITHMNYTHEWLIYGPIKGPAFHCVPWKDLGNAGINGLNMPVLDSWKLRVLVAKEIATLFRSLNDRRPDTIIAVTIILACLHEKWGHREHVAGDLYRELRKHLSEEMKVVQLPSLDCKAPNFGLVNTHMYKQNHYVEEYMGLLERIEKQARQDGQKRKRRRED